MFLDYVYASHKNAAGKSGLEIHSPKLILYRLGWLAISDHSQIMSQRKSWSRSEWNIFSYVNMQYYSDNFFNVAINYYMICPHIIVLMMDGRQHFKTCMLLHLYILLFSAFLFLGAGILVSSLALVFEKICCRKQIYVHIFK